MSHGYYYGHNGPLTPYQARLANRRDKLVQWCQTAMANGDEDEADQLHYDIKEVISDETEERERVVHGTDEQKLDRWMAEVFTRSLSVFR